MSETRILWILPEKRTCSADEERALEVLREARSLNTKDETRVLEVLP